MAQKYESLDHCAANVALGSHGGYPGNRGEPACADEFSHRNNVRVLRVALVNEEQPSIHLVPVEETFETYLSCSLETFWKISGQA